MCRKKSAISLFPHQAHTSFCPWHSFNMLFWTTFYFSCLCYFCIKIARFIDRSEFIHLNETNLNHNTTSERRKKSASTFCSWWCFNYFPLLLFHRSNKELKYQSGCLFSVWFWNWFLSRHRLPQFGEGHR